MQQIVSLSENSASLGHVLMVHWHQTDNFRVADIGSTLAGEIGDHVIRRTEYEDALSSLSKWAELLAEEFSVDPDTLDSKVEKETLEAVKNLLRSKRELLTELISTETEVDGMETGASAGSTETGRNPCAPSLPASLAQSCRRQQKTCEGWSS